MKKPGRKSKFTSEYRRHIVERYLNGDESLSEISAEIGVACGTVKYWVENYRTNGETCKSKWQKRNADKVREYQRKHYLAKKAEAAADTGAQEEQ